MLGVSCYRVWLAHTIKVKPSCFVGSFVLFLGAPCKQSNSEANRAGPMLAALRRGTPWEQVVLRIRLDREKSPKPLPHVLASSLSPYVYTSCTHSDYSILLDGLAMSLVRLGELNTVGGLSPSSARDTFLDSTNRQWLSL